ncbi:MAG: ATP-dependent Clp protease adapter ClpS [Thermodesulfobacteriota bacterium]
MSRYNPDLEDKTESITHVAVTDPPMFRVLLHNDDFTTMDFVVQILMQVFHKTLEEATRIMLNVHRKGIGLCGVYVYEVAETKVDTVHSLAREHQYPLKCTMEKDE